MLESCVIARYTKRLALCEIAQMNRLTKNACLCKLNHRLAMCIGRMRCWCFPNVVGYFGMERDTPRAAESFKGLQEKRYQHVASELSQTDRMPGCIRCRGLSAG